MIQSPQPFVVREECEKAAFQNGFRRVLGETQGWAGFASTTARGAIQLAAASVHGPWFLALDHASIITELGLPAVAMPGPGKGRYAFETLGELYAALNRVYALGVSLPDAPLREFELSIANLPRTTEAERLVVQRVGQDIFRARLMDYWQSRCPLTGITDPALLRASHIIPWAECENDADRLDVHNGLLLSALWDAAFDAGLVGFDDSGRVITSPRLTSAAIGALNVPLGATLSGLTEAHRANLAWHRTKYGLEIA
jgi:hypothetical protein